MLPENYEAYVQLMRDCRWAHEQSCPGLHSCRRGRPGPTAAEVGVLSAKFAPVNRCRAANPEGRPCFTEIVARLR